MVTENIKKTGKKTCQGARWSAITLIFHLRICDANMYMAALFFSLFFFLGGL